MKKNGVSGRGIKWLAFVVFCCIFNLLPVNGSSGKEWKCPRQTDCQFECYQTYALCTAASCDKNGNCGGDCNKADQEAGRCGYCYVITGKSCAYHSNNLGPPCSSTNREGCRQLQGSARPSAAIRPGDIVYSTWSPALAGTLKTMKCPNATYAADCMNAKCIVNNQKVKVVLCGEEVEVYTATCQCAIHDLKKEKKTFGATFVADPEKSKKYCHDVIWSASVSVDDKDLQKLLNTSCVDGSANKQGN